MADPFTPSPELAAIARRWLESYAGRNADAAANLFSSSDALSYIGSGEGQMYSGDTLRGGFAAFTREQPVLEPENIEAHGFEAGNFGYAYTTLTIHAPEAGMRVAFRNTFVFSLENAVWRIVHIHNSNPILGIDAMGYESVNLEMLVDAATQDRLELGQTGIASVMFTDIADSTALAAATGDQRWSRLVTAHFNELRAHVEAHGGTMVKSLGDGTLSTFPSASAAMQAAIAIMQALDAQENEPRLTVRIGIHTGDVVEAGDDFLGTVVNKAARVAAAAAPGEIRVSDATRIMVGASPSFAFSDPVEVPLKGLEGLHSLQSLQWQT